MDTNLVKQETENRILSLFSGSGMPVSYLRCTLYAHKAFTNGTMHSLHIVLSPLRDMTYKRAIGLYEYLRGWKGPAQLSNYRVSFYPQKSDWRSDAILSPSLPWSELKDFTVDMSFNQKLPYLLDEMTSITLDWERTL
jgi:hypothetical protein